MHHVVKLLLHVERRSIAAQLEIEKCVAEMDFTLECFGGEVRGEVGFTDVC